MTTVAVAVTVSGAPFDGWDEISISASVRDACRAVELGFPDKVGAPIWPQVFPSQAEVKVTADGELVFAGLIDGRAPRIGSAFRVSVTARSKGQDLCDCTVDHTRPDYVNSDVLRVAQDQDRFGIGFTCDFTPDGFARWRPNVGRTLFDSLAPLCEEEGATMASQADGSVKITRAGASAKPQGAPLVEGRNIVEAGASFDDSGQHSEVKAHGQSYKGNGTQALQIVGTATNGNVKRMRPLELHHDRETTRDRLKRLAGRKRDIEQGEGVRASFVVRGWRDDSGMLWTPGNKVFVKSPSLGLCQSLLIEHVVYTRKASHGGEGGGESGGSNAGTSSALHCVDPRAHGGGSGGVNKSGAGWGFDSSDPT